MLSARARARSLELYRYAYASSSHAPFSSILFSAVVQIECVINHRPPLLLASTFRKERIDMSRLVAGRGGYRTPCITVQMIVSWRWSLGARSCVLHAWTRRDITVVCSSISVHHAFFFFFLYQPYSLSRLIVSTGKNIRQVSKS